MAQPTPSPLLPSTETPLSSPALLHNRGGISLHRDTDGSANTVTLNDTVKNDQTVTVAYTDPSDSNDTNAVQDIQGNDVASLTATDVTNNSDVPGTPPTFSSAAITADGKQDLFSPTTSRSPPQPRRHQPSLSQPMAQPTPSPLLPSTETPLSSPSTTPSKTTRPSLLPTQIHPIPTTPTPFRTSKAMTSHP